MRNKKYISILLSLCFCAALSGCGSSDNDGNSSSKNKKSSAVTSSSVEEPTEDETEAPTETEAKTEEVTEAPTEAETEPTTEAPTEKPTKSEDDLNAEAEASGLNYLERMDVFVLGHEVCDIEDARFDCAIELTPDKYENEEKATMITLGIDFNTNNTWPLKNYEFVDESGNVFVSTFRGTSWGTPDDKNQIHGIVRFRIAGEHDLDDLKLRLTYKDKVTVTLDKELDKESSFDDFCENIFWHQDFSGRMGISDEEKEIVKENAYPYVYKINGVYCYVEETFKSDHTTQFGKEQIESQNRGFKITPLQGPLCPIISEEDIKLTSAGYADYTYCEFAEAGEDKFSSTFEIKVCCNVSKTDWFENFDELPEDKKQGEKSAELLADKYIRYEARNSYVTLPDGEGGTVDITCSFMQ